MGMFTTTITSEKYLIFKWSTPSSKIYKKNIEQCKILSNWQFDFFEKFDPEPHNLSKEQMIQWIKESLFRWDARFLKLGIVRYIDGWSKNVLIMKKTKENKKYREFLTKTKPPIVEIKEKYLASNYHLNQIK